LGARRQHIRGAQVTSHNAYIRPSGVWTAGVPVLHGEFAAFDLAQFQSINGDLGGTWAPSSIITIGGAGLNVTGPFQVHGSFHVYVGALFDSTVNAASFEASTDITADRDLIAGRHVVASGNATIGGNITAGGDITATGDVSATGNLHGVVGISTPGFLVVGGAASVAGAATITGQVTAGGFVTTGASSFAADVTLSGSGSIVERIVTATDADATFSVSSVDTVFIPHTFGSTPRTFTIDHMGAVAGKTMMVVMETGMSSTTEIDLLDSVGGRILPGNRIRNSAGNYTSVMIKFINSQWRLVAQSGPF